MRSLRCAWIWKRWRSDKRSMVPLSISFDHNTCTRHVEYHLVHDARTHTLNFLPYICDGRKLSTLKCGSSFGTDCSWECRSRDPKFYLCSFLIMSHWQHVQLNCDTNNDERIWTANSNVNLQSHFLFLFQNGFFQ